MYEAGVGGGLDEGSKAGGRIGLRSGRPCLRAVGTLLAQPVRIIGTARARSVVADLFRRSHLIRSPHIGCSPKCSRRSCRPSTHCAAVAPSATRRGLGTRARPQDVAASPRMGNANWSAACQKPAYRMRFSTSHDLVTAFLDVSITASELSMLLRILTMSTSCGAGGGRCRRADP